MERAASNSLRARRDPEDAIGEMTRTLPGILRLAGTGSRPSDADGSGSRPGRDAPTYGVRGGPLAAADSDERRKAKKRVTFRAEEHLEVVMEISPRLDSPLSEELEPCDPEKLMLQRDGQPRGDAFGAGYAANGVGGKKAEAAGRIGGILGFGLSPPVAPPLVGARRGRPGLPDRRPHPDRLGSHLAASGARKRVRSAPPLKSSSSSSSAMRDAYSALYESPIEQVCKRHAASGRACACAKSAIHGERTPSGYVYRGGHGRPRSPASRRELLTANLSVINRSRAVHMRLHGDPAYAKSLVHQSPYRQGSSTGARRSSSSIGAKTDASSSAAAPALSVTGSRMDAHSKTERRATSAPSVSPRKIQAWQEANDALRTNGLLVSEPCIAQLWNTPKNAIDPHFKCS